MRERESQMGERTQNYGFVRNIKWLDDDGWISHATTTTTIILNPFQIGADEKRKKKVRIWTHPLERSREKMLIVGICGAASWKSDARSNVRDHLTPVHRLARRYHYDGDWNLTTWSKCVREREKECGTNSVQTSHTPRHFSTSRQLLSLFRAGWEPLKRFFLPRHSYCETLSGREGGTCAGHLPSRQLLLARLYARSV